MITWGWAAAAAAAPVGLEASVVCTVRTQAPAFDAAVADAELAVRELDEGGLDGALARLDALVPCLEAPLFPDQVARWYRASGVQAAVRGETDAAVERFRAARGVQPAWRIDETMGAPILSAWAQATPGDATRPLPRPAEGSWTVDGSASGAVPVDRPFVVQWLGADGAVRGTARLDAGTSIPPFGVGAVPVPVPVPVPIAPSPAPVVAQLPATVPPRHPSRGLALAGLGAGLLAGAGIATAATLQEQFLASDLPSTSQPGLIAANRIVGYGAGGLGVAAIGLGVSAVVVGRW